MSYSRRVSYLGGIGRLAAVAFSAMTLTWACTAKSEASRSSASAGKATGEEPPLVPVEPATVDQLEPVFHEIPGWTRGPLTSKSASEPVPGISTTPVSYSGVQTTYSGPQIYVDANLVDSVDMAASFSRELEADRSHQAIRIAFQRYPSWTNRYGATLYVMIKRRFLLTLSTGTAHNDLASLTGLAQKLDLGRLDRLN